MVVAILMESNTSVSDQVLDVIIDKARSCLWNLSFDTLNSVIVDLVFIIVIVAVIIVRHLETLMLMKMVKLQEKNGRLLLSDTPLF